MSKKLTNATKQSQIMRGGSKPSSHSDFDEVMRLINEARLRAVASVNTTLIELYWEIGAYISRKIESAAWGEGVVEQLAGHIAQKHSGLRGFTLSDAAVL